MLLDFLCTSTTNKMSVYRQSFLLPPRPTCIAHTIAIAILLNDYCCYVLLTRLTRRLLFVTFV